MNNKAVLENIIHWILENIPSLFVWEMYTEHAQFIGVKPSLVYCRMP